MTPKDQFNNVVVLSESIDQYEKIWMGKLANLQPIAIPYADRRVLETEQRQFESVTMPVPSEVISFYQEFHSDQSPGDFLLAAFVGYLARIGGTENFDIGFTDIELAQDSTDTNIFSATHMPCHFEINLEQGFKDFFATIQDQVVLTKQHKTYAKDVVARYPELQQALKAGKAQIFPVVIEQVEKINVQSANHHS
jgi:surfactin family lipopeptide synthetase A